MEKIIKKLMKNILGGIFLTILILSGKIIEIN